jgi:hypothetical protein
MPRRLSFQLANLLFACGLLARAHAAELGDVKVNSFIGQHLSADIELTSIDEPAAPVQVRLASIDVYRGANLDMPAVLASLNLSVVRRDGKQFLHVTSTRPVDADHLHLYLDLGDGNRRGVRLATLWFAPDPMPPALPERVAIPMAAPAAVRAPSQARKTAPIRPLPQSSLPNAKAAAAPDAPMARIASEAEAAPQKAEPSPAPPAAAKRAPQPAAEMAAKPVAKTAEKLAAKTAAKPSPKPAAEPPAKPVEEPASQAAAKTTASAGQNAKHLPSGEPHAKADLFGQPAPPPLPWVPGQPARPAPLKLAKAQAAPVCRKQPSEAESTCTGLDTKNAELRAEIGKLEARVNSLLAHENPRQPEVSKPAPKRDQLPVSPQAERPQAEPSHGQTASGMVKPVQPASGLPAIPHASPRKAGAAKADDSSAGMPWGLIAAAGAAIFAAVGALQLWHHRRKRPKSVTVHAPLPAEDEGQIEPTLG